MAAAASGPVSTSGVTTRRNDGASGRSRASRRLRDRCHRGPPAGLGPLAERGDVDGYEQGAPVPARGELLDVEGAALEREIGEVALERALGRRTLERLGLAPRRESVEPGLERRDARPIRHRGRLAPLVRERVDPLVENVTCRGRNRGDRLPLRVVTVAAGAQESDDPGSEGAAAACGHRGAAYCAGSRSSPLHHAGPGRTRRRRVIAPHLDPPAPRPGWQDARR
jgi:hypothetical protein